MLLSSSGLLAPFSTSTLHSWTPGGYLVVGRNDAYEIEVRRPGAPVLLSRNVEPARLKSGERAEWEEWNESMDDIHRATGDVGPSIEHAPIPATKPYFRDILVGDGGRIWVHRYVRAERREPAARPHPDRRARRLTWMEPPTFDVFDPDGTFLATVVLPHDVRVLAVRDRRVWVVHMDKAGVERVVRLRVESEDS